MAKGYVIAQIEITDMEAFAEYGKQVPATVAEFGGRYLVRGGTIEEVEGKAPSPRMVVIEFPSVEDARAWYDSDIYQPLVKIRQAASKGALFFIDGYEG